MTTIPKEFFYRVLKENMDIKVDTDRTHNSIRSFTLALGMEPSLDTTHIVWYTSGYCLGCNRTTSYPDGTVHPIQSSCITCYDDNPIKLNKIPYEIYWEAQHGWCSRYMDELLTYLQEK